MPGDENPTCADDRCCYDETDGGIAACYHWHDVIGYIYDADMDPVNHDDCWTGISLDPGQSTQAGCRNCERGCDGFKDSRLALFLTALWVNGKSYMRSVPDDRHGRNAKNQVFDLLTNHPTLVQRQCRVEHGSCYENNPLQWGGYVCWGHHVCQCTPEPDTVWPCPTAIDAGYPVGGLTPDIFFFNFHGALPSSGESGTLPSAKIFCRKWDPAHSGASPRNAPIRPHLHGSGGVYNATFLRGRGGFAPDVLIPCSGLIAASGCTNPTYGDCTYGPAERDVGGWINDDSASQGRFRELRIVLDAEDKLPDPVRLRDFDSLSAQQAREHQLYQDVFSEMIGRSYPNPEGGLLNMDRVAMPLAANAYIGYYERYFDGTYWTERDLPRIIVFEHSRTRWGNVPVLALMVIVKCKILIHLTVPHFAEYVRGAANKHWLKPFATVEIRVETAMQCLMPPTGITVDGEPVVLTSPTWGEGPDGGYDGIPTVTPEGNEIIYARELDENGRPLPVRVPRKWRWFGRLGSFSFPATGKSEDFDYADMTCGDVIDLLGTFEVPALATANESTPADPNRNYAGSIAFHFAHEGE